MDDDGEEERDGRSQSGGDNGVQGDGHHLLDTEGDEQQQDHRHECATWLIEGQGLADGVHGGADPRSPQWELGLSEVREVVGRDTCEKAPDEDAEREDEDLHDRRDESGRSGDDMPARQLLSRSRERSAGDERDERRNDDSKRLHLLIDEGCEAEDGKGAQRRGHGRYEWCEVGPCARVGLHDADEEPEDGGHRDAPQTQSEDQREASRGKAIADDRQPRCESRGLGR